MSTQSANSTRGRRGFALIVALAFVVVVAGLVAIVGHTMTRFARNDRRESDSMVARQLIDSGAAWARFHAAAWPTENDQPRSIELDVSKLLTRPLNGSLILTPRNELSGVVTEVEVRATLQRPNRWTIKQAVRVHSGPPKPAILTGSCRESS